MAKKRIEELPAATGLDTEAFPTASPDLAAVQLENGELKVQLAAANLKLKQAREERCLDALQAVLAEHGCQLTSLPDGRFQVVAGE